MAAARDHLCVRGVKDGLRIRPGLCLRAEALPLGHRAQRDTEMLGEGACAHAQRSTQGTRFPTRPLLHADHVI
jgi:hypothetical protein